MIDFFSRLDMFMKYKGLNDNKITVETGISNGLIGKGRKRGALSQDSISKILHTYQDLDANWLFTGKGEMLKSNTVAPDTISNQTIDSTVDKLIKEVKELSAENAVLKLEKEKLKKDTKNKSNPHPNPSVVSDS